MWGRDDKLLKCSFVFPHGQGPKLPPEDMRQQRVAEQTRCPSQLAKDAPRVEQEHAQIAQVLQREYSQQDEIFPLRVWLTKGYPWLRRHSASSIDVASAAPTRRGCRKGPACVLFHEATSTSCRARTWLIRQFSATWCSASTRIKEPDN